MAVNMPVRDGPADPESIRFPDSRQCICDLRLMEGWRPARLARKTVHTLLCGFGVLADQTCQVEDAVAELVANSERYARKPWQLRVYLDDHALWVGVFDGDVHTVERLRGLLVRRDGPDLMEEHGRGLLLARAACRGECWVRTTRAGSSDGKEVLMRFATTSERDTVDSAA